MRFKQDELTNVKWLLGTTLITHYEDELIANEFVQYHFEENSRTNTDAICHGKNCYNKYSYRTDRDIHFAV